MQIIKAAHTKHGDTMIEVMFAIAVFALISVLSIIVMNSGVATVEASLELSMARNEIDAQSEVIRFIHNSFLSERKLLRDNRTYADIWKRLTSLTNDINSGAVLPLNVDNCSDRYATSGPDSIFSRSTIIFNTRVLDNTDSKKTIISANEFLTKDKFKPTQLNPRLIFRGNGKNTDDTLREDFTNLDTIEGIWIIPIKSEATSFDKSKPEFYDFHIYTCWNAPGRELPTTIGTIMRIYNPELIEAAE